MTDAQGRLTYFNPAAVEFSGRVPSLGTDQWCVSWKLFRPDGTPLAHDECPMAVALKERRSVRGAEAIAERPDGTRVWFQPFPTPLFDDDGVVVGGINMLVDITERKRAEAQREAELADTKLLQEISAAIIGDDDIGSLYGKIMNAAVAIMRSDFASMQMLHPERGAPGSGGELKLLAAHGFTPEAEKFWEWVGADSPCICGMAMKARRRAVVPDVAACEAWTGTYRDQYLDGGIFACQSTPLLSRRGQLIGMISTHWKRPHTPTERDLRLLDILARQAADLIERKQADRRLQQALAQRTEEVIHSQRALAVSERMAAVGTLAAGLAHDMRNVLLPLGMRLDAILTSPELARQAHADLAVVCALHDHLRAMARNLSLFAQDPEQEGVEGVTDLSPWCAQVRGFIDASAGSAVFIKWEVPDGLPMVAIAPHRLTQAVLNLIHNARDAIAAAHGEGVGLRAAQITVEVRSLWSSGSRPAHVILRVRDNGCGMTNEVKGRCLEPFFTTKDRPSIAGISGGTGMGLSLVHAIVERAGGSMAIESESGKGTMIALNLPVATT